MLITAFGMSSLRPQEPTLRNSGWAMLDGGSKIYVSSVSSNPVFFHNVKTLVASVAGKVGKEKIGRLRITDHGNSEGCLFGEDFITVKNYEKFVHDLILLSSSMHPNGWVHLTHCEVGKNENLLQLFAATFGVAVYAATAAVNGWNQVQDGGGWTRCSPTGTIYHNAFLPGESDYQFTK